MSVKQLIKEYLSLPSGERRGIWVLLLITLVLIIALPLSRSLLMRQKLTHSQDFEKEIAEFEEKQQERSKSAYESFDLNNQDHSSAQMKLTPFDFDPNNIDPHGLKKLGLNDGQIKSIIKFREKGGVFRFKEDFSKLYVISKEEYETLEPFIQLPLKSERPTYQSNNTKPENVHPKIEINSADSTALIQIKGIGPTFASRIIRYRNRLGGFFSLSQLLEVKGIDSMKYSGIAPQMTVNPYIVRKMNINTASFDELKNHPYIGYNIALSLVNYRKQHGPYAVLSDIKNSALVNEAVYQKISPYLKVQ